MFNHKNLETDTVLMHKFEDLRSQFPILSRKVHSKPLIYLDSAATSQKPQVVIDAESEFYKTINAGVHRGRTSWRRFRQLPLKKRVQKLQNSLVLVVKKETKRLLLRLALQER